MPIMRPKIFVLGTYLQGLKSRDKTSNDFAKGENEQGWAVPRRQGKWDLSKIASLALQEDPWTAVTEVEKAMMGPGVDIENIRK